MFLGFLCLYPLVSANYLTPKDLYIEFLYYKILTNIEIYKKLKTNKKRRLYY